MSDHDLSEAVTLAAQLDAERELSLNAKLRLKQALEELESLRRQVRALGIFITDHFPREPSRSKSAVECAIKILGSQQERLRSEWERADRNEERARHFGIKLRGAIDTLELLSTNRAFADTSEMREAAKRAAIDAQPDSSAVTGIGRESEETGAFESELPTRPSVPWKKADE